MIGERDGNVSFARPIPFGIIRRGRGVISLKKSCDVERLIKGFPNLDGVEVVRISVSAQVSRRLSARQCATSSVVGVVKRFLPRYNARNESPSTR